MVFFCQNNQWAISVPLSKQTRSRNLVIKARAYGIPGIKVDGNDVLAVYRAATEALDQARSGEGPTFIEAITYRMMGHSTADDPTRYRSTQEVEDWEAKDPLVRFWRYLERQGVMDSSEEEAMRRAVTEEVTQGIEMAEAAGPVAWTTLLDDVYEAAPWNLREQRKLLSELQKER